MSIWYQQYCNIFSVRCYISNVSLSNLCVALWSSWGRACDTFYTVRFCIGSWSCAVHQISIMFEQMWSNFNYICDCFGNKIHLNTEQSRVIPGGFWSSTSCTRHWWYADALAWTVRWSTCAVCVHPQIWKNLTVRPATPHLASELRPKHPELYWGSLRRLIGPNYGA